MEDLQKELRDIKALFEGTNSRAAQQALEKVQLDLEEKIAHPIGEVKIQFQDLRGDMKNILVEIRESNKNNSELISGIRDVINKTFLVVVDTRFKVSLSATVALLILVNLRTALRRLKQRMPFFFRTALRTSNPILSRSRQWPPRI